MDDRKEWRLSVWHKQSNKERKVDVVKVDDNKTRTDDVDVVGRVERDCKGGGGKSNQVRGCFGSNAAADSAGATEPKGTRLPFSMDFLHTASLLFYTADSLRFIDTVFI